MYKYVGGWLPENIFQLVTLTSPDSSSPPSSPPNSQRQAKLL